MMLDKIFDRSHVGSWQAGLALVALLALVFVRAPLRQIPDALFVSDGFGYYIYLPSLVLDRDVDFSNQLTRVPYEASKSYFDAAPKTGLRANPFPVGSPVLWLPFFLLGHVVALGLRAVGAGTSLSGFGYVYELPTYCGAFLYGVAALWLIERLIAGVFSRSVANLTLFSMLVCTPYAYYLWVEPDVSHVNAAFTIALFLYAAWRAMRDADSSFRTWVGVGACLGLVALVRPYNGLIAVATLPAVWYTCRSRPDAISRAMTRLAACAATAAVVFVPQVAIATAIYGGITFLPPGTLYDRMMWTRPNFVGLAVSIFSYFPVLVVAFVGLFPIPRLLPGGADGAASSARNAANYFLAWVKLAALLALLAVLYITAAYPRGSAFGDSFGQRRIVDWVPLLAIGFAACLAVLDERQRTRAMAAICVLGVIGVALTGLYTLKLIPEWGMAGFIGQVP